MEWEYFVLFALVLAQMLRTNQMLATFHAQLDTLLDRQAILIMPVQPDEVDPQDLAEADGGTLTDLVKQWDES
jgi:hypothetical protein|tara:strand:- start:33 stop:251 length:219 start_codon:yes stop_codon:yes gene_type:complete